MSFIKLDDDRQKVADQFYELEKTILKNISDLHKEMGEQRWFSIGKTNFEQGFMAIRKGICELQMFEKENGMPGYKLLNIMPVENIDV